MSLQFWANVMTAMAVGVSLHSLMEPSNIRNRVQEINAKIHNKPYEAPKMPFTITAWRQSLLFGVVFVLALAGIAFGILSFLSLSPVVLLIATTILLFTKESINTVQINSYHGEIGTVIESVHQKRD